MLQGMGTERDFPSADGLRMQGAGDALLNCTLETCMVLKTNVTSVKSV